MGISRFWMQRWPEGIEEQEQMANSLAPSTKQFRPTTQEKGVESKWPCTTGNPIQILFFEPI
jgi:hypothetical protein